MPTNMEFKKRFIQYPKHSVAPQRTEEENQVLPVYGNLVVTPTQIEQMADNGIPISAQNMAYVPAQGEKNPSWEVPISEVRGVDPAELWESSERSKQRIKKAHKVDRQRYGDVDLNN